MQKSGNAGREAAGSELSANKLFGQRATGLRGGVDTPYYETQL